MMVGRRGSLTNHLIDRWNHCQLRSAEDSVKTEKCPAVCVFMTADLNATMCHVEVSVLEVLEVFFPMRLLVWVSQQFRMGLLLSGLNGNAELSESDLPL